jgi:Zn-dependent protease with chaperone function
MGRLFFASLFTLSVLASFVAAVVILAGVYAGSINLGLAIVLTIVVNVLLWLIGPAITDLMMSWFYSVRFMSSEEVRRSMPEVAQLVDEVSVKYHFPFPKVGIIPDRNPTAFTYGSARYNARIVLTEGIFHYLDTPQARAVVAHELGHVVNRDFIVMMIGSTLVQILYEIYAVLMRTRGRAADAAKPVALVAYALYFAGVYVLYYLSRTREYLADEFSARTTSAKDLADALVKIAYGIVVTGAGAAAREGEEEDEAKEREKESRRSRRLLQSTRQLGISDVRNARHVGVIALMGQEGAGALARVAAFDRISPWAKFLELGSTHPLTGNRLARLGEVAKECGQPFDLDIDSVASTIEVDRGRMYGNFAVGLVIYLLPALLALVSLAFLPLAMLPAAAGLGLLLQLPYKFAPGKPVPTTVVEAMSDPYASPIRGRPVALTGKVIGRGIPGYIFGEDMMYQDSTGLTFLDYSSAFGSIGDFFFGATRTKSLIGKPARAVGWFFRNFSSLVSLGRLETEHETVTSHPILWRVVLVLLLFAASAALAVFWTSLPIPGFLRAISR